MIKLTNIVFVTVLFLSFLCACTAQMVQAASPAVFPPYVLELNKTMIYRVVNSVNGVYRLFYYSFGGSCGVAVYWWDDGWEYAAGITIPEGGVWEENAWIPEMACIAGYRHVQVSSSSTTDPKVRFYNPGASVFIPGVLGP